MKREGEGDAGKILVSLNDQTKKSGFTLLELLVVIAIISLLLSITLPLLGNVKERARRLTCQNNIRMFVTTIHVYGNEHNYHLPTGFSDFNDEDNTISLSSDTLAALVHLTGNEGVFVCPWLGGPFKGSRVWHYENYGKVIGYNYLGGHRETPWPLTGPAEEHWKSPQLSTESSYLPIVTEFNGWILQEGRTFAPHGLRASITQYAELHAGGMTSKEAGAAGGNIGFLDGAVRWKAIETMKIHRVSLEHPIEGAYSYW